MSEPTDSRLNRAFWDELALIHLTSAHYDVTGFLENLNSLRDIEVKLLGDLTGKSLLHLQCHIGLDSISLARRGADVVGVDFSTESIRIARELAASTETSVTFVEGDVYHLPELLEGRTFQLVFASYGVLAWLNDLSSWAQSIASHLKPGGRFILVDDHPFARTMCGAMAHGADYYMAPAYPYSNSGVAIETSFQNSYADPKVRLENRRQLTWAHSLEEIIGAFLSAKLRIAHFSEYFKCSYKMFNNMELLSDNWWHLVECSDSIPLTFAVVAERLD